jgi:CRISPR-associated endonuclease/helicase Cas3
VDKWKPWIASVTGHHGVIPQNTDWHVPSVKSIVIEHDKQACKQWFQALLKLFKISGNDIPNLLKDSQAFIAGLCSVSDWIASNDLFVRWIGHVLPLEEYFNGAKEYCIKTNILEKIGIINCHASNYKGVTSLLPANKSPRQIQTLINDLPPEAGLLIIEATTGSGKTEAALAFAWNLIASGKADAIVFALPTQATANAMLERLQDLAPILFENGDANLVLAHGKAKYNAVFADIKNARKFGAAQKGNEASVQCAEWITSSRKRVFLGQIGVCTIDQVLLSVLPVRHNFVRSFGLMKSVLIVDEVHAYDRYMYGLLEEVLKRQKVAGGSAILLSATLPAVQKKELFEAWHKDCSITIDEKAPYPLISRISISGVLSLDKVEKKEMPPERKVSVEIIESKDMEPDDVVIEKLLAAAKCGATIAVVCNLVQSAQMLAHHLRNQQFISIDIFHARYRFKDRQSKEEIAKKLYGKDAPRTAGRILVATQVVEQSLDLDFDWLITQLCPIDLLFQRMGRLHRHERKRPIGFENPFCTILTNKSNDFGVHKMIYGDSRILWRTREILKNCHNSINFPSAYRELIETVYGRNEWEGEPEPEIVIGESCAFRELQKQMWYEAQQRATNGMNPFTDTDQNTNSLTRGKEMGLSVVPIQAGPDDKTLLDGEQRAKVNEFEWDELLNLNSISVPAGWKIWLPRFEEGYIYLPMVPEGDGWKWENGKYTLKYTTDFGLEKLEDNE